MEHDNNENEYAIISSSNESIIKVIFKIFIS